MRQELAALPHEMEPPPQEIARRPHRGRVDVGLRPQAGAQEPRDLARVDFVVLGLAAVNRLHRERVAQDEGDAFGGA